MATMDLPHGTLHYHQSGSGPPIVFLHGHLMGANLWDPVVRPLIAAARVRMLTPLLASLKFRPARSLPSAYGWLSHGQPPHELIDEWIANHLADNGVRRDTRRLTAAMADDAFRGQIAAELAGFANPVLLAWAADDTFFPLQHARRLAAILPDARLEVIAGSRTWVMCDQPERTADLIGRFARRTATTQAT